MRVKSKKETDFGSQELQDGNVLGLICMDIIAYKGRHISFLLMNLHIICTNALVGDQLVLKKDPFLEHQGRIGR